MNRQGIRVTRGENGQFTVTRCMRVENDSAQVTVRGVELADVGDAANGANDQCLAKITARVTRRTERIAAKRVKSGQLTPNGASVS